MQLDAVRCARTVACLLAVLAACRSTEPTAVIATAGGPVSVALEVANTPATREQGLMYRQHLADGHGMLFVFEEEEEHPFWMKNTIIPLDMVFIGSDGRVVGVRAETTPFSLAQISVGRPSKWVLEVPGGFAARRGIDVGDRVELSGVPPS